MSEIQLFDAQGNPLEMDLQSYFEGIHRAENSGVPFPVDFDVIWPMVFTEKRNAKRSLLEQCVEGIHFSLLKNEQRNLPEVIMLSTACTEFFVGSRRKDIFDIYIKCRQLVQAQLKALDNRPWERRAFETVWAHCALVSRYAPGYFSTVSVIAPLMMSAEVEILLHDMKTFENDRMDTSIGMRWAPVFIKEFGAKARKREKKVTILLPDSKIRVQPWLYPNESYPLFQKWYHESYIPVHLMEYISAKKSLVGPFLTKASVANNLSVHLTGKSANLPQFSHCQSALSRVTHSGSWMESCKAFPLKALCQDSKTPRNFPGRTCGRES